MFSGSCLKSPRWGGSLLFCYSAVCGLCTVCLSVFALPFSVYRRLCSVIVALPGHLRYYSSLILRFILMLNLNSSNTDGSFTMANSNSFFEFLRNSSNSSRKQIFKDIFLFYHEIVSCIYSLELPHRGDSNAYTQHTVIV